jgi:hypothetical protein
MILTDQLNGYMTLQIAIGLTEHPINIRIKQKISAATEPDNNNLTKLQLKV